MITEMLFGIPQAIIGFKQMKALSKVPQPGYSAPKELQASYNRAEQLAQSGFTPAEAAQMRSSQQGALANQVRTGFARTGSSMGGALSVIAGLSQNQFNLGFGAQNAQLRRENIRYADQIMGQYIKPQMMQQELNIMRDQAARDRASNLANQGLSNIAAGMSEAEGMAQQVAGLVLTGGLSGLGGLGGGGGGGASMGGFGGSPSIGTGLGGSFTPGSYSFDRALGQGMRNSTYLVDNS